MARLNISINNEMVKTIQELATEDNKTVSSIVTESIGIYQYLKGNSLKLKDVERFSDFVRLAKAIDAIPVPAVLLDFTLKGCVNNSPEDTVNFWRERGKQLGEIVKNIASSIDELKLMVRDYSLFLPLEGVEMKSEGDKVFLMISGTGYSKEAAQVTAAGIEGFLEVYGYCDFTEETIEGFVKVSGKKKLS